uniref:Uncharacterized protein n=1 Tax=Nelumbo nucifera TaxID=4432 RepID=A0A822XHL5_NELNU|nr:TPA_asm: hypothetical protein HUJ06_020626 [Nelumbo nucifera]
MAGDQSRTTDWPERDDITLASIERKVNSVDLPLSLRMIKKKRQWQEGFKETSESAYCSVKKAFSSMMREILFYEDLQGILDRVQEMHASFVWLFQQVFSHTPTLMEGTTSEEEVNLWNAIVEEASRMQASMRDEALDHKTMQQFVSPIKLALSQEPDNPLILANYAQFLYLVFCDHDK